MRKLGEKRFKRTLPLHILWDKIISNFYDKNTSMLGEVRDYAQYIDIKGMYSGTDKLSYFYTIDGYPTQLPIDFRIMLRNLARNNVTINFLTHYERHTINWSSSQMTSKLRTWSSLSKNETREVDEFNLFKYINSVNSRAWRSKSLAYMQIATTTRQRKAFRVRTMLIISGNRGSDFDSTLHDVLTLTGDLGVKLTRVLLNVEDYIKAFSPFSLSYDARVMKSVGNTVLTDELAARLSTYSHGAIGFKGIIWGNDIYENLPVYKQIKSSNTKAENILIVGETGSGKSLFLKLLLLQLLASPNIVATIMDIEGFEYVYILYFIANSYKVVLLNMAEGQGNYYDSTEIICTGNKLLDQDMYNLCVSFTIANFKAIVNDDSDWVDYVINDAITLLYRDRGVEQYDMNSWGNSLGCSYYDIYEKFKLLLLNKIDLTQSISSYSGQENYQHKENNISKADDSKIFSMLRDTEGYKKAVERIVAECSKYFETWGNKNSVYKNKISLSEIVDAKLVVCSFGMAGKTDETIDKVQLSLMQLFAANISHLRSIFSKHKNMYNIKGWEEFQRWGKFKGSEKVITTALTGGRKLGDINIIASNKPGDLLDDDRFGVFSNITSIAIGCIGDAKVREDLCNRLSIPHMLCELDKLVLNNSKDDEFTEGDTVSANMYDNAFLVGLDKARYTITKMLVPPALLDSNLLKTGTNI